MIRFNEEEALAIKQGNVHILKQKLEDLDTTIIKSLKANGNEDDIRFYQGAASITDALLKILQ